MDGQQDLLCCKVAPKKGLVLKDEIQKILNLCDQHGESTGAVTRRRIRGQLCHPKVFSEARQDIVIRTPVDPER